MISVDHLCYHYKGGRPILRDVSFELDSGRQYFHRAFEYIFQIFYTCSICRNHLAVQFLRKSGHFAHTDGNRRIRQSDGCTFFYCFFCYFPGNGLLIQSTENNASFSFQQIVTHTYF